jgi:hypothetical protein
MELGKLGVTCIQWHATADLALIAFRPPDHLVLFSLLTSILLIGFDVNASRLRALGACPLVEN